MPSVVRCRSLLRSLQLGASICFAASSTQINLTTRLSNRIQAWKRRGLVEMILLEDLTDLELERLLFDTSKGRFEEPDFDALHERLRSDNRSMFPEWLAHFRGANRRPHYPATFLQAYRQWQTNMGLAPAGTIQIRFEHVHKASSADEFRRKGVPSWPGVNTIIEWG